MTPHSSGSACGSKAGTDPAFSYSAALWTSSVASPPSSTICDGPLPSGQSSASRVHHQYSSSVSPFQANTGMPLGAAGVPPVSGRPTTTAAAAWSWVEKMLHDAQRTSAPRSASVSIRTAVWMVMCRLPMIRAPARGFFPAYRARTAIRPGISCSASLISFRPHSARARSATLNGARPSLPAASVRMHAINRHTHECFSLKPAASRAARAHRHRSLVASLLILPRGREACNAGCAGRRARAG